MDSFLSVAKQASMLLDAETYVKTVASVLLGLLTIYFLYRSVRLLSEVLYFFVLYVVFTAMLLSFIYAMLQKAVVKEFVRMKIVEFIGSTV